MPRIESVGLSYFYFFDLGWRELIFLVIIYFLNPEIAQLLWASANNNIMTKADSTLKVDLSEFSCRRNCVKYQSLEVTGGLGNLTILGYPVGGRVPRISATATVAVVFVNAVVASAVFSIVLPVGGLPVSGLRHGSFWQPAPQWSALSPQYPH